MYDHAAANRARTIADLEGEAARHERSARTFRHMVANLRAGRDAAHGLGDYRGPEARPRDADVARLLEDVPA